jgi:pimeloyl-ACP methyl ester carboxylesterase
MAEELFRPIFVPDKFREAVSGRAWLGVMLGAEGALAVAEARADLIPPDAAEVIVSCCKKVSDAGLEVIPDAAHLANFEQPEAITQAILDHLSPVVREGR